MIRFLTFAAVILSAVMLNAADPKPAATEESVEVTVVGTLHTGIMAIGGETTGTTISAKGITWELDFDKSGELRAKANALGKQKVVVKGTLERRPGVEVKERWIVHVTALQKTKH